MEDKNSCTCCDFLSRYKTIFLFYLGKQNRKWGKESYQEKFSMMCLRPPKQPSGFVIICKTKPFTSYFEIKQNVITAKQAFSLIWRQWESETFITFKVACNVFLTLGCCSLPQNDIIKLFKGLIHLFLSVNLPWSLVWTPYESFSVEKKNMQSVRGLGG